MDSKEFYDYIVRDFTIDGVAARLVDNIIKYVERHGFSDAEDAHTNLKSLLEGAFGIEERDIKLYRAPECEVCGEYAPYPKDVNGEILCADCAADYEA